MAISSPPSGQSISSNDVIEKTTEDRIEDVKINNEIPEFDQKATRRLLRKIDIRLIPFLALLYL